MTETTMHTDQARTSTQRTPAGPFTVIAVPGTDGQGVVVLASGWTDDPDDLAPLVHRTLRPAGGLRAVASLGAVSEAVTAYHEGGSADLAAIDAVAVAQQSGAFCEHAWKVLRAVPPGRPVTYAAFAEACGNPAAVRAAAGACARNAAALFVPCHRVVRTGGGLGGFRWGLDVKRWLLEHEAFLAPTS